MNSAGRLILPFNLLEFAVESGEASELEDWVEGLVGELRAPVPCAGQSSVDARTSIVKIVGAGPVEGASKKVVQDVLPKHLETAESVIDHVSDAVILLAYPFQVLKARNDRAKDAWY